MIYGDEREENRQEEKQGWQFNDKYKHVIMKAIILQTNLKLILKAQVRSKIDKSCLFENERPFGNEHISMAL